MPVSAGALGAQYLAGLGLGLAFQLGIGPVSLAMIHKAINDRWLAAWAMAWGVALTDGFYITLAALGAAALVRLPLLHWMLGIGGCLLLLWFAWRAWRAPLGSRLAPGGGVGLLSSLGYGVAVTLTNPMTVLFWSGVFGQLVLQGRFATPSALMAFGLGCVTATLSAQTVLSVLANRAQRWLTPPVRRVLNRVAAVVLAAFALRMALGLFV